MGLKNFALLLASIGLFAANLPAASEPSTTGRIVDLTAQGAAAEAYEIGLSYFAALAGNADFDQAFGLAALEAGHTDHALLAFERAVDARPQDHRARLELARTYFALDMNVDARDHFQRVLATEPPPNVQEHIRLFLGRIDRRERARRTSVAPHIGLELGHDSNLGSSSDDDFFLVVLGELIPLDMPRHSDSYGELSLSAEIRQPLSRRDAWYLDARLQQRRHPGYDQYDQRLADLRGGFIIASRWGELRLPLQYQDLSLDGEPLRRYGAIGAELSQPITPRTPLTWFSQLGLAFFPQHSDRNALVAIVGAQLGYRPAALPLQLGVGLLAGLENAHDSDAASYSRRYLGLRGGAGWQLSSRHALELGLNRQAVRHMDDDPLFAQPRNDRLTQLSLHWHWQPAPHWSLRTGAERTFNDSSLDIYQYNHSVLRTALRYSW